MSDTGQTTPRIGEQCLEYEQNRSSDDRFGLALREQGGQNRPKQNWKLRGLG